MQLQLLHAGELLCAVGEHTGQVTRSGSCAPGQMVSVTTVRREFGQTPRAFKLFIVVNCSHVVLQLTLVSVLLPTPSLRTFGILLSSVHSFLVLSQTACSKGQVTFITLETRLHHSQDLFFRAILSFDFDPSFHLNTLPFGEILRALHVVIAMS